MPQPVYLNPTVAATFYEIIQACFFFNHKAVIAVVKNKLKNVTFPFFNCFIFIVKLLYN